MAYQIFGLHILEANQADPEPLRMVYLIAEMFEMPVSNNLCCSKTIIPITTETPWEIFA